MGILDFIKYSFVRPIFFCLNPEIAHGLSIAALKMCGSSTPPEIVDQRLAISLFGTKFPNPLGIAAGYDKNGEVVDKLLALGFGFTEIGTLTPKPQFGNPKPRIFRLVKAEAMINRLGFGNKGYESASRNLEKRRNKPGIVGVNIGPNMESTDFINDYILGIRHFCKLANYIALNISSPNTPGLRDLHDPKFLSPLLHKARAAAKAEETMQGQRITILLKVSPDISDDTLSSVTESVIDADLDGLIISNTTTSRENLEDKHAVEAGGLSGRPLFEKSTRMIAKAHRLLDGKVPIIGVGGIDSFATALAKITAGASLIQLYTGLVYKGPELVLEIMDGLSQELDKNELPSIEPLVGSQREMWI